MMLDMKTTDFLNVLSSKEPVPGGGGASAAVGAFAAALGMMVAALTEGKKKYASVEAEIQASGKRLEAIKEQLIFLADEDAAAFLPLSRAYAMPAKTEEQQKERDQVMEQALYDASIVPLQIMETVTKAMKELVIMEEKGSRLAVSDAGVGILFAQAALEGASLNVRINTKMMKDRQTAEDLNSRADALIREGHRMKELVYRQVLQKLE